MLLQSKLTNTVFPPKMEISPTLSFCRWCLYEVRVGVPRTTGVKYPQLRFLCLLTINIFCTPYFAHVVLKARTIYRNYSSWRPGELCKLHCFQRYHSRILGGGVWNWTVPIASTHYNLQVVSFLFFASLP